MYSDLFFLITLIISVFLGLLMFIDYRKYKMPIFLLMFFVYLFMALKSMLYIGIPGIGIKLTDVKWIYEGDSVKLYDMLVPLYNFKYFLFQYFELLFIIALSYMFILTRRSIEKVDNRLVMFSMWFQYIFATIIMGGVVILSLLFGDSTTFTTNLPFVEFFKGNIGRLVFIIWKLILLIFAWSAIASVFGYVSNLLKMIAKYKRRLFTVLIVEILFNVSSAFLPIYAYPNWFVLQIFSMFLLTLFAFGNHTGFITSVQDNVALLTKEKDLIVSLMKEISAIIGSGEFDLDTVIRKIVSDSVKGTNARGGAALLKDPITNRLIVKHVEGLYPPTQPFKTTTGLALTESIIVNKFKAEKITIGEGLLGKVASTGEPIFIPDALMDENFSQTLQEHMTVTSFLAVPLKTKEDVFGVLTLVDDSKMFLLSDLSLLETLGEQAAITIKQMQMYQQILDKKQAEKEIGVAGEIQSSLIPHTFPDVEKYDLYGFSIPAKGVGGDYYDYIDFGNNKIALTMFDVSGKGVPASLIMVMIRSILRTIASLNEDTKDVLIKLNNTIAGEIVEDRYATGFYLLFDAEKGIMSYTNAGHGPLILYRNAGDDFEFLDTDGMPIGIMTGVEYGQNYTILEKGDIAILYTDGITEAMNSAHEEFGMERMKEVIRKNKRESAREIANKILEAITRFAAGAPQHDDETLLVLKNK